MRQKIAALAASAVVLGMLLVPSVSGAADCGYEVDGSLSKNNVPSGQWAMDSGDVNTVALGEFNQYSVTLGAGTHHVVLQGAGDLDLRVCKGTQVVCTSDNPGPVVDGCLAEGLTGNPGIGDTFTGAGTYKIQVRHCTNTACGYPADAPDLTYTVQWFTI